MDGRFSDEEIVAKVRTDQDMRHVKKRIEDTDVLVVDEISMLSWKVLSQVEFLFRKVRGNESAFGCVQVILSGDFFQLKPVPSVHYNDPGDPIIRHSELLKSLIPHHFVLETVHRQTEGDLIAAVHELSTGFDISQQTYDLIKRMRRPLPPTGPDPVKIFAQKYDVERTNSECLLEAEGEVATFVSEDDGDRHKLDAMCPAHREVHVKVNAPVMLIVNMSDTLVNGSMGTVEAIRDDHVMVKFGQNTTCTKITRRVFSVYDAEKGSVVATRIQLPLHLGYAFTVNKVQGQTMNRVHIDCRNMHFPGQLGVAVGRVTKKVGLRIVNFTERCVVQQPQFIFDYYRSPSTPCQEDLGCCRKKDDSVTGPEDPPEGPPDGPPEGQPEGSPEPLPGNPLEPPPEEDPMDFSFLQDDDMDLPETSNPDLGFSMDDIVQTVAHTIPDIPESADIKSELDTLKGAGTVQAFGSTVYAGAKGVFVHNVCVDRAIQSADLTRCTVALTDFVLGDAYQQAVRRLFRNPNPSGSQYNLAFMFYEHIRNKVVEEIAANLKKASQDEASTSQQQFQQSETGLAKLRYIAGWCIAKVYYNKRQSVLNKLYKQHLQETAAKHHKHVVLLEQAIRQEGELENSKYAPTLAIISERQNIKRSLTNVSDEAFEFFLLLDKNVRTLETLANVNVFHRALYEHISSKLRSDQELCLKWSDVVGENSEESQCLRDEVIQKYINMSANQFCRELKDRYKLEKKMAHRKAVMTSAQPSGKRKTDSSASSTARKSRVKWPCGICGKACVNRVVACDGCDVWHHYKCVNVTDQAQLPEKWYCEECRP